MLVQPVAYGDAPYGNVESGTPASLSAMTREDLLQFRSQWWRPELASVVVSGGIEPAAAQQISRARCWATGRPRARRRELPRSLAGDRQRAGRTLVVDLPGAGQAAVYAFARGLKRADPDFYDAAVANSALGGSSTGRLFDEVRVKRALSYGAYSSLASRLDDGTLVASAQTKNESAADVAKVFLDELDRDRHRAARRQPGRPASDAADRQLPASDGNQRGLQRDRRQPGGARSRSVRGAGLHQPCRGDVRRRATAAMARMLQPDRVSLVIVGDAAKFIDKLRAASPECSSSCPPTDRPRDREPPALTVSPARLSQAIDSRWMRG